MARRLSWLALAVCGAVGACGGESGDPPAKAPGGLVLRHDFGSVPHGKATHHDFVVDTHALGEQLIPLGVQVDCSCARWEMLLRDREGNERVATGQPYPQYAARPDEELVVRMHLLTAKKEAVDHEPATVRGRLVLQPVGARTPAERVDVGIEFRFAIDSPVHIHPFAHLDFGEVPMSRPYALEVGLESDLPEQPVRFGPVHEDAAEIEADLRRENGDTVLRVRFVPQQEGPFKDEILVDTDLPDGYRVRIPVSAMVVPDIVVKPMNKVSLGLFDLTEERESFVLVTDHDRSRSPEFSVARLVDESGADVSRHFEVRLRPVAGDPRTTRVVVHYMGTLDPAALGGSSFRGRLVLAKDPEAGPFVPIEVVAFHRPR